MNWETAQVEADKMFRKPVREVIPAFKTNFKMAKRLALLGHTVRKDMPVIQRADVWLLQRRLKRGSLDINAPFAPDTDKSNPFPEGLRGEEAQKFLRAGFRDKTVSDDVIPYKQVVRKVGLLKPIQQQIYFDKALAFPAKVGPQAVAKKLMETFCILSSDNYIIDGHHRWLGGVLVDPETTMQGLVIDLPIKTLLKLMIAYGDAIGNKRNL